MRKLVTALSLALCVALAAADPLICPDGCTDDAQHSGRSSHPCACLSCQDGIASSEPFDPISAPTLIESEPNDTTFPLTLAALHAIDYPPRFA